MDLEKDDYRTVVEIGTLALGATGVALPRLSARIAGADPDAGANTTSARALGFWLTTYGALLQFAETDDERDRLMIAGAACGSAFCVNTLAGAARGRLTWRGAITEVATVGALVAAACLYLSE